MTAPFHIAIVIPARDEQELLPRCLRSIQNARLMLPSYVTSDLVVVADQSTDDTFRIAWDFVQGNGTVVESEAGRVGAARALGVRHALERYDGALNRCWLANTDADCQVPATWLLDQLASANAGFSAIAGVIEVDSFGEHEFCVSERFRRIVPDTRRWNPPTCPRRQFWSKGRCVPSGRRLARSLHRRRS